MSSKAKDVADLLGETIRHWQKDRAPRLAAALAYYATFSLAPLLTLVVLIAGFVIRDSQQVRGQIVVQVEAAVGRQAAEMVATLISGTPVERGGVLAGAISLVLLVAGTVGVFGQLQDALNTIWDVAPKSHQGIWERVRGGFVSLMMVAGLSLLLLVSLLTSTAISFVSAHFAGVLGDGVVIVGPVNAFASLGVVTLVFAAAFKVLPDADVAWRDVWVGALLTAALFTVGKELLGLYLGRSSIASVYGAAGAPVAILAWVYYSAQILFFGAEFTKVYARRRGSRAVRSTT